jgi:hypothetical protein
VLSSALTARPPAIWGRATLAMAVSRSSMKVARVTVMAMNQGLMRGRSAGMRKGTAAVRVWLIGFVE